MTSFEYFGQAIQILGFIKFGGSVKRFGHRLIGFEGINMLHSFGEPKAIVKVQVDMAIGVAMKFRHFRAHECFSALPKGSGLDSGDFRYDC